MNEQAGDIWTYPSDAIVITTNGTIKKNGACVMGRGVAAQAKNKFPGIDMNLGRSIEMYGNLPYIIWEDPTIISLPVKHNWYEKADIELIKNSLSILVEIIDWKCEIIPISCVVLPRPGCGNGGLNWKDVKPVCQEILDDRFVVVELASAN